MACLSVPPSLCSRIETVQARITKFLLWAAMEFIATISCSWVRGFPSNEGVKQGYPVKRRYFAVIGSYSVKTVADSNRHVAYHNKHW